MRITPKIIYIQTKPIINTHCNTKSIKGKIKSEYSNKIVNQVISLGID